MVASMGIWDVWLCKGAFILADIVARVETMSTFVRRHHPMRNDASMNAPLIALELHPCMDKIGNLIPGEFCTWKEMFAILMENLTTWRDILYEAENHILDRKIWPYSLDILHFFQPWLHLYSSWRRWFCLKSWYISWIFVIFKNK